MTAGDVLVVAATKAEAAHVERTHDVLITGIGKVRAAIAVTRALESGRYRRVVNIGTAGALHDHHSGLFVPSRVLEHDISADRLRGFGYTITDEWELPGGDGSVLATGDTFVTDSADRDRIAARADLVDMEGAAIAAVCAAFEIPVQLVKVVSDNADDTAMDWPSAIDSAAVDLARWLDAAGISGRLRPQ
ncbi:nucleosidase [Gordonia shandongensis]|uniref:nucleosidase n=1 Tax=Gordonia shandongensis TaxID=376351 RepID=UPI0003FB1940|nr:nucleosidase [Gordonia shandongensis]